jgi:hypothetical protein
MGSLRGLYNPEFSNGTKVKIASHALSKLNLLRFDGHGNLREKERGPDVRKKEEQGVQ